MTLRFTPGCGDAAADDTDAASFEPPQPRTGAFRNYIGESSVYSPKELMVDRAQLLTLTAPEMTALIGGLRVLGANYKDSDLGVFTERRGTLSNDFFGNLLKTSFTARWQATEDGSYVAHDRQSGSRLWRASRVDLIFGSNAELRAIAESYAADDAEAAFLEAFVAAWSKVMELDRFDLHR